MGTFYDGGDNTFVFLSFRRVLNVNTRSEELIYENIILSNAEEAPPPTYYEVNGVIGKLKIHTAAGSGNILYQQS